MQRTRCSPAAKGSVKHTCLEPADVEMLKDDYNDTHATPVTETDPFKVVRTLERRTLCKDDLCLVRKLRDVTLQRDMEKKRFRPFMPAKWKTNINEWLYSTDIVNVLRQYEIKYPTFKFLGPSPTDYYFMETKTQCVWKDLCRFDLEALLKTGKRKIGVVFNIDPHNKPGSHWVALFIDAASRNIYYFDSTGDIIHKDILRFVHEVQAQSLKLNSNPYTFDPEKDQTHPLEHQYGDTECGMYVLFFIITMLQGSKDTYVNVFKNPDRKIPDEDMEKLRHEYFNEPRRSRRGGRKRRKRFSRKKQ